MIKLFRAVKKFNNYKHEWTLKEICIICFSFLVSAFLMYYLFIVLNIYNVYVFLILSTSIAVKLLISLYHFLKDKKKKYTA